MAKARTLVLLLILLVATATWATQSTNYGLTLQSVGGGGVGVVSSPSYGVTGKVGGREVGEATSASYIATEGFIPSVYAPIFGPIITSVTPAEGKNIAPIDVTIAGSNFDDGLTVKLTSTTEADLVGYDVTVVSSAEITCSFNLAGAAAGFRTAVVTNPDTNEGTLGSAFNIKSHSLAIGLAVNSPNPFDPASENTTIVYTLAADTNVNVYMFTTSADLVWKRSYVAGTNGGQAGDNSIIWNGINDFAEMASNGVYLVHVLERNTGRTIARGKIAVLRR